MSSKASQSVLTTLLSNSTPVISITGVSGDERSWYRSSNDSRHGPWYSGNYSVNNNEFWRRKEACIYFVCNSSGELRYVGKSLKCLYERWRLCPAYDENRNELNREEIFHSQCWKYICEENENGGNFPFNVSVLHGSKLVSILSVLDHKIGCLGKLEDETDIVTIALERWVIKWFKGPLNLWNKRK